MDRRTDECCLHCCHSRHAAKEFSVPRSTLQKVIDRKTHIGSKPGKKPLLGNELETNLVDYAVDRAAMGIGFGKKQFFEYAISSWPVSIR